MSIAVEEADETVFWLELLGDTKVVPKDKLALLFEGGKGVVSYLRRLAAHGKVQ
jgi:hypothetical protein